MNSADIRAKIDAQDAAKLRAKAIIEISEDLTDIVRREVGRVVSEEIGEILDVLADVKRRIEAAPRKDVRRYVLRMIDKVSNRLSITSAGYASGSLPKVSK